MDTFNRQPRLTDGELLLRPLAADDWNALFAVASDPLVWAGHPIPDRWQEPVFRAYFADALASGGALVVVDQRTGTMIGASRYDTGRTQPGEIEIGWTFLARSHWGGRTNAAMKALMVGHALAHYPQVVFFVGATNLRSQRAMTKIGGVLTGREPVPMVDGVPIAHVVFAIDRDSFANGPLARLPSA